MLIRGAAAAATLCLVGTMAIAQSRLGATDGRYPLGGLIDGPHDVRSGDSVELAAVRLLLLAQKDLAEGRTASAQRILEQLIGRYPDTASAIDARRELYALYAADKKVATGKQPVVAASPLPSAAVPQNESSGAALPQHGAPATATSIGSGWRTSIVSFRRLQDDLRNTVGDRIFFSGGSAELGSRARSVLAAQAEWVLRRPDIEVVVEGHADDAAAGSNDDLMAAQRATAVRDRLIEEGLDASRIRTVPLGSRDRIATCDDSDCAAQNRRAVVLVGVRGSQAAGNPTLPTGADGRAVDVRR